MKSKLESGIINIVIMISTLVISLVGSIAIGIVILFSNYHEYTKRIIVIWAFILIGIGVFQLVTNKIKFKYMYGRTWGVAFIISSFFLVMPYLINVFNEVITVACNYNQDEKYEKLMGIVSGNFSESEMDNIYKRYTLSKFENTIGILDKETIGNITYYYDDDKSKESVVVANDLISKVHNEVNKYFKVPSETPIDIAILKDFKLAEKYADSPDGFVNSSNKKLYIKSKESLENMSDLDKELAIEYYGSIPDKHGYFENVLLHEYTHKLTAESASSFNIEPYDLPHWFYEGMAVYVESLYYNKPIANSTSYLDGLKNNSNFQGPNRNQYYERSAVLINYIIKTYGDNIIVDIISNINDDTDIYKALEKVTGESFETISEKVFVKI
ncbi:MAG: hypothetical protein ACRDA5_04470 [Clostridium sp.]